MQPDTAAVQYKQTGKFRELPGKEQRDKCLPMLPELGIFCLMVAYFTVLCPLAIYDTDDWIYIQYSRIPVPLWGNHNPTRVFPETLMPLTGWIAAHVVYPFAGDYVGAVTCTAAVVMAMLTTLVCRGVRLLMSDRMGVGKANALFGELFFCGMLFAMFRNRGGSRNLFYAADLCCVFFYTASGMLNMIAVLIMLRYQNFQEEFWKWGIMKKLFFCILLYFCIFSNIFHSGILAVLCLVLILGATVAEGRLRSGIRNQRICTGVLACWCMMAVFELSGERARQVEGRNAGMDAGLALRQFAALVRAIAWPVKLLIVIAALVTLREWIVRFRNGKGQTSLVSGPMGTIMVCLGLTVLYLLAVCSKVHYMSRIEATWGIWSELDLLLSCQVVCTLRDVHRKGALKVIRPAALACLLLFCIQPDGKYMPDTIGGVDSRICMASSRYFVDRIRQAAEDGSGRVELIVPDFSGESYAWAVTEGIGENVETALRHYGIIQDEVDCSADLVPEEEFENRLHCLGYL